MLYCESCRRENRWPESFHGSIGTCEVCGKRAKCYDVASSELPRNDRPISEIEKLKLDIKLLKEECERKELLANAALSALNHIVERLPRTKREWLEASIEMQIVDLLKNNWHK